MLPLREKENQSYYKQNFCNLFKNKFNSDIKIHQKGRDHDHYTCKYGGVVGVHIYNLRCKNTKEIPLVLHNGQNYDYHLIIKKLVAEFAGQFECLGENTEKYIIFSVPIEKELGND